MTTHPNLALVDRGFELLRAGDKEGARQYWAEDAIWNSAGKNWLVGSYRGIDRIGAVFRTVRAFAEGTFTIQRYYAMADDQRVITCQRVTAQRKDGRKMDMDTLMVVEVVDGKIQQGFMCPYDIYVEDDYYGFTPPEGFEAPPKLRPRAPSHFHEDDGVEAKATV